jgi:Tol biopolymer transport system component
VRVFEDAPRVAAQGQFAPGGAYVAYASSESGQLEVYVRPSGGGEGKWQISTGGGATPRFRRDGKELFYMDATGMLWAVPTRLAPTFEAGKPVALFRTSTKPTPPNYYGGAATYDVSPDGQRILVLAVTKPATAPPLNVILGWKPPARP